MHVKGHYAHETSHFYVFFQVTCEILIIFVPLLEIYEVIALSVLDEIGYEYIPGEEDYIAGLRDFTYFIYYFILVLKGKLLYRISYLSTMQSSR